MEKELESLIEKYELRRQNLGHQIATAMKLGYQLEANHLRTLREHTEDAFYDLKNLRDKYVTTPNPAAGQ